MSDQMRGLFLLLSLTVLITASYSAPSDEVCQSLIKAASTSVNPVCEPHGDCTGLNCYTTTFDINVTFVVEKCCDPVLVNITILNATTGNVLYIDYFNQSTIKMHNNMSFHVVMHRNETYVHVQVLHHHDDMIFYLIPFTEVPLNASVCMCESVTHIKENVVAPVEKNCSVDDKCIGVECDFTVEKYGDLFADTEVDPCTKPPGFLFVVRNSTKILYDKFFNESMNTTLLDNPFNVIVVHNNYSMIIYGDIIAEGQSYRLIPETQIILDKSKCKETPLPTASPTTSSPISNETCESLKNIANQVNGLTECTTNDVCDTLDCITLGYDGHFQIKPCNNPPAVHATVYDPDGDLVYDRVLTNTTDIVLPEVGTLHVVIHDTPDAIGLQVELRTPFSVIPLFPYTEVPIDRCLCNDITCSSTITMTTTSFIVSVSASPFKTTGTDHSLSTSIILAIVAPLAVVIVLIIVSLIIITVIFVVKKRAMRPFSFHPVPFGDDDDDDDDEKL